MKKLILTLTVLFSVCFLNAQQTKCTIQVLVSANENDLPLEQVQVWCKDKLLGFTDRKGEYLFTEAKLGEQYTFTVKLVGYEMKSESRWAKEAMNKSLGAISLRTINSLITQYQTGLKENSNDKKRMDNLYKIIIASLDMESNIKDKTAFIAQNKLIEQEIMNPYKVNMQKRDEEIIPIVKDNLDKLTEFKR